VKKFLLVLVVLGVTAAIGYLLFSRLRETSQGGAEPEIDLREMPKDEAAGSGTQIADPVASPIGTAN
jgi:hypothetical protein